MHLPIVLGILTAIAVTGTAQAESRTYDLKDFTRLSIANGINASVQPGAEFAVSVETDNQDILDRLTVATHGDTLVARFDQSIFDAIFGGALFGQDGGPVVDLVVSLPELHAVSASSGARIDISAFTAQNFEMDVSSGAHVKAQEAALKRADIGLSSGSHATIAGSCDDLKINASSGSHADASGLACQSVDANASSGSDILAAASQSLDANASSGADITVHGNPQRRDIDESSGGDVHIRD